MINRFDARFDKRVAPFTGAWIEMYLMYVVSMVFVVAPFTGAWIEISGVASPCPIFRSVAPFTGAWIEIRNVIICSKRSVIVAPFTGAWIEIKCIAPYE